MRPHDITRFGAIAVLLAALSPGAGLASTVFPPLIAAACPQFPVIDAPGTLCEDFDTDRNATPGLQFTRLPAGLDPQDPLYALGDPNDDVLGYAQGTGLVPAGTGGGLCTVFAVFNEPTCSSAVSEENDWHLHTAVASENIDPKMNEGYEPVAGSPSYAPDGGKAHSGLRSMHWGRHTNVFAGTRGDTLRFRQVAAFVLDPPVNLGETSTLEFWQIVRIPMSRPTGIPEKLVAGGGQVHISLLGPDGRFEKWRPLTPSFNGYPYDLQSSTTLCEFDPDDDQAPPIDDETMCSRPVWNEMGDVLGDDATCVTDTDGNDAVTKDCGDIRSCAGNTGGDPWPAPGGEECTENGSTGQGVWARSVFDLSSFAGRRARLRWIGTMGGGWSFGTSRSFLEPAPGNTAYQVYEEDDGWWIDDIVLTDLRTEPLACSTDLDGDGVGYCTDCDKDNPEAWALPGEADDLTFTDEQSLTWTAPAEPGANLVLYDTLRSTNAANFVTATTCLESDDGSDTFATDPATPPANEAYHYLVRPENACPNGTGPVGTRADGTLRSARSCP